MPVESSCAAEPDIRVVEVLVILISSSFFSEQRVNFCDRISFPEL